MPKEVCFSGRTSDIALVISIAAELFKLGIQSFYQEDISLTGANWQAQWFKAAFEAIKIVCILSK